MLLQRRSSLRRRRNAETRPLLAPLFLRLTAVCVLILLSPECLRVESAIDADGVCSLLVFVPYTISFYENETLLAYDNDGVHTNFGFSYTAAALIAIDHFNTRNTTIVPELEGLTDGCNVTLQAERESFIDTGSLARVASQRLFATEFRNVCAFVGPFNDYPAQDLATLAQAAATPIVVGRSYNPRVVSNFFSRYASSVYPEMVTSSESVAGFLRNKGRTNYISFLYSISETNYQRREHLAIAFDSHNMTFFSSPYLNQFSGFLTLDMKRSAFDALERLKQRGFRTIVVGLSDPYEILEIANAAEQLGMNQGDYMWVWYDVFDFEYAFSPSIRSLISGSVWIIPVSSVEMFPDDSPFASAWKSQGVEEINRLNAMNPIFTEAPGYRNASSDFFVETAPEYGSGESTHPWVSADSDGQILTRSSLMIQQHSCMTRF